jgi:polyhydroxybutyrate depolymerase
MRRSHVLLVLLGLGLALAGCSRSNLTAIGPAPAMDSGSGGSGSDGGSGGSDGGGRTDGSDSGGGSGGIDSGVGGDGSDSGGSSDSAPTVCPSPGLQAGDTDRTVQVGSTSRSYVLHIPPKYDNSKPAPLILDLHAQNGTGAGERAGSPYPAQTDPEGVVMAFPTGLKGPAGNAWNVGPCCVAKVDDVAFARALVVQVETIACIDPTRVYAVGLATGGGMAYYLACHAADVFAAIAPAAFDLLQENVADCIPSRPVTVISFRGTEDPLVPYAGGPSSVVPGMPVTFLGAQKTFEKWAEIDQCTGTPSAKDSNGCSAYSNCQDGVEVILCTKQGGGLEAGNASVAWPVLKSHTL